MKEGIVKPDFVRRNASLSILDLSSKCTFSHIEQIYKVNSEL